MGRWRLGGCFVIGVAAAACVGPTPASGERDELARVEAEPRAAEGRDGDEGSMATVDHSETVWATVNTDAPGGQTGMEGVSTMMDCPKHELPPPTEAEVVALVSGVHRSTLAHRPVDVAIGAAPGSGGLSAIELDVSPAGPGETKAGCGQVFELPVAVGLTIEEPKIDIEVKARIAALSSQYALLRAQLEPQALAPLGLPEPGPAQVTLGLAVAFTPEGIYGELETGGGPQCGVVVFPGNRRCDGFRRQTGLDIATAGVTPREVLQGFPRTFALNWESGDSTELTIELVGDPAYACGTSPPDDVSRSEHPLSLGALTHIETLDGRLNVELPAVVDYGVGTQSSKQPRSWDGGYIWWQSVFFHGTCWRRVA